MPSLIKSSKFIGFFIAFMLFSLTACRKEEVNPSSEFHVAAFSLVPSNSIPRNAPIKIESVNSQPVLLRGVNKEWDSVDLLNPSVVRFKDKLFNYYSGYDGNIWRTGVAISKDGIAWEKFSGNPVLEPNLSDWDVSYIAANGSAVIHDGKVLYFYQGIDKDGITRIGLASSDDGFHFKKLRDSVFNPGIPHSWESKAVADPYVIEKDGYLYLYYLGQDDQAVQRLGVARSKDGISWIRLPNNPVLDVGAVGSFDENGLGEPSVAYQPPYFYMLYTGRDSSEARNIGYAISTDGTHWKKVSFSGLLTDYQRSAWFSKVVCDTTLLPIGNGKWLVWFGGGDKPMPAQNLDGQIGLMTLDLGQNRDMTSFNSNSDWSKSSVKSTDVLSGSYEIEGDAGNRSSWVGPKSSITLATVDSSGKSLVGKTLVIEGWVPAAMMANTTKQNGPQTISISVNSKIIAKQSFNTDDTFTLSVPWADVDHLIGADGSLDIELSSDRSFVPAKYSNSNDARDLAYKVTRIHFQ